MTPRQIAEPVKMKACRYNTSDEFEIGELAAREYVRVVMG
jgi:hypothetical protein